ncbi:hypothetical protein LOTGIDRAFT_171922 [Lottia gigantea]|uniref:Uncharacterized protein n=1 Tax=Lottia gigantea TaxID=225164 RepID=V4AEY5_LOTGI|nr:hypothetical protein LOTGIDRAFT_171922 [Lottia gigantea]ESP02599.1 hypothetical protein LOTGIDRAFT_171922 [Lottia gigantea]
MKVLALIVILGFCAVYANQEEKRQLGIASLAPLIGKAIGVDKLVGSIVSGVTSLFKGKSGDITIPKTNIKLHYKVDKCHVHVGKRFIIGHLVSEKCKATVSESAISKTSSSCTTGHQESALKCAMDAEVKKLQALANTA